VSGNQEFCAAAAGGAAAGGRVMDDGDALAGERGAAAGLAARDGADRGTSRGHMDQATAAASASTPATITIGRTSRNRCFRR